uniref:DUF7769 domain-containing protein n=1 Tax=Setaria viridis TaxID=4556 RepID=A0A4U6W6T4_SETVI|nr:hypothetical protein SEVIR_2G217600v2 [Setaria viridis]
MPGLGIDLNLHPPESGQIYPIDWDDVAEFDGPAHELDYDMVWDDGIKGSNDKKRKFYHDDLKTTIYLDLLSKTDLPILCRGVLKSVSEKFDVPLRVVQSIWKNGQDGGIQGIVNKYSKNRGRKRVEINLEAIKNIPLKQHSTFQDLANALGVKKCTLYKRFKEGYFRRHTNDLKFSLTDEKQKSSGDPVTKPMTSVTKDRLPDKRQEVGRVREAAEEAGETAGEQGEAVVERFLHQGGQAEVPGCEP